MDFLVDIIKNLLGILRFLCCLILIPLGLIAAGDLINTHLGLVWTGVYLILLAAFGEAVNKHFYLG